MYKKHYLCHMIQNRLWLAPMLGLTESVFRNCYVKHFSGFDIAIAPFTTLVEGKKIKEHHLRDLRPKQNLLIKTIPQVLGNNDMQFVLMNKYLMELCYDEINWNLGCPAPRVASRKRGSGLLPYPDVIDSVLDTIFNHPHPEISVKLRLGYKSADDIEKVIPVLNRYPLKRVCIHPRIGTQLYEGTVDLDTFEKIIPQIHFPIVYSGDIFTADDFYRITRRFPNIHDFMLGRGILLDPFLPEKIRETYSESAETEKIRFKNFAMELFQMVIENSNFEPNALNKTKEYWSYFSTLFEHPKAIFDRIKICQNILDMKKILFNVFENETLKKNL